ncbi:M43 family zinc metalloprotease [Flavobacterium sinopsychrotolerans]|uniref:Por secretion system C-terminal sorting domain-containing protein n=1 Tax=Flavobacterium sinopsychrotolerans TaxID=604089 RepID=A0A1H8Q2R0_9FLAO|nr:M43 family zinc metalloprotease [Flavobacterium sinopsychrotolerans]SEO48053.1 Por secretion system C-terminal sorting domain-containing protein [Flavobacterium sinopsychrotolerans]
MKKITFLLLLSLFSINCTFAQATTTNEILLFGKKKITKQGSVIRCASTEYEEYLKSKNPNRLSTNEFEQWITPKIILEKNKKQSTTKGLKTNAIITIPVVVHVIHSGDILGVDENIFDEQVISQIQVLNDDFRKKSGTPGFNTNPVGADVEIEFALAKRDPAGVLSNGINHVNLGQESWSTTDINDIVKPQTQWDPEKYLNIWVVNFSRTDLLGYAQFPSESGLRGINTDEGPANTDGVVIGYKYFGSSVYFTNGTYTTNYDKGRTTSHEVGHWLGLRHIWGDGGCDVDDFCEDTPNAGQENEGCPTGVDSCPTSPGMDMVENYMDYTYDACMNIFTADQKTRMITVMNNSIRRVSLQTSDALTPGVIFDNDASTMIVNLNINSCSYTFSPIIKIVNKGNATLTKASFTYGIDNNNLQTFNWTGNLANNESQNITLNSLTTSGGNHNFSTNMNSVNGTTDQNNANNTETLNFDIVKNYANNTVNFTIQIDRYGTETTWKLTNSAGLTLYEGGPYTNTAKDIALPAPFKTSFNIASNDCYTFTIIDKEGDGICCDYGNGSYTITTPTGEIIATGGEFGESESKSFRIGSLSTANVENLNSVYLYPNPTSNILNVVVENKLETPEAYTIINTLGQIMKSKKIESTDNLQINVSNLSQGIYFLKLSKSQSETKTIRFIKK